MALEPSPMQAVLVQDAVVQVLKNDDDLGTHEEELLNDFCNDVDLYLVGVSI